MIFVDRATVIEPDILTNNNADINGEKQKAINYFELNIGQSINFSIYKNSAVKTALKNLFKNKCAYCESMVPHISYPHVEHWRPKAKVKGNPNHKGYYWLASDWDNLLLACSICNGTANKGNNFPILTGSNYAYRSTDKLVNEQPLLINPCLENPTSHLKYRKSGAIQGITVKGKNSVKVYGLNRQDLIIERKKIAKTTLEYMEDVEENISEYREAVASRQSQKLLKNKERKVKKKIKSLKEFCENCYQYSGMTKYLIETYRANRQSDLDFITATKSLLE